jgi:hypothetical protein
MSNTNLPASDREYLAGFLLSHRSRLPFTHEMISALVVEAYPLPMAATPSRCMIQ